MTHDPNKECKRLGISDMCVCCPCGCGGDITKAHYACTHGQPCGAESCPTEKPDPFGDFLKSQGYNVVDVTLEKPEQAIQTPDFVSSSKEDVCKLAEKSQDKYADMDYDDMEKTMSYPKPQEEKCLNILVYAGAGQGGHVCPQPQATKEKPTLHAYGFKTPCPSCPTQESQTWEEDFIESFGDYLEGELCCSGRDCACSGLKVLPEALGFIRNLLSQAKRQEGVRIWTEAKKMKRIFTETDPDNIQDKETYGYNLGIEDVLSIINTPR